VNKSGDISPKKKDCIPTADEKQPELALNFKDMSAVMLMHRRLSKKKKKKKVRRQIVFRKKLRNCC